MKLVKDADPDTAKLAIAETGRCAMVEAAPLLTQIIEKEEPRAEDAAAALIEMKTASPDVLLALEKIVMSARFDAELRGKAAQAMGGIEGPEAGAALIKLVGKLDRAVPLNPPLLEKAAEAWRNRPSTPLNLDETIALLRASQKPARIAAASCLLRAADQPVKDRVAGLWS